MRFALFFHWICGRVFLFFFPRIGHSILKSAVVILRRRVAGDKWHIFTLTDSLERGQGVSPLTGKRSPFPITRIKQDRSGKKGAPGNI